MRFSPRTTVAALATVAALSGGALALGGSASADTTGEAPARTLQVQDSTPAPDVAPDTAPDTGRDWDCPEKDGQGGTGPDGGSGTQDGTSDAPDTAPVTTEL